MPCWARESTSLMSLEFFEVSSSSSLTRLVTGPSWRCTYFLRAKGLILPQKPSCVSSFSGSRLTCWSEDWSADCVLVACVLDCDWLFCHCGEAGVDTEFA